ncbi:MAG: vWA domain-containing protein [Pseudobdellovibrio sp.]
MVVVKWGNSSAFYLLLVLGVWTFIYFLFEKNGEKKLKSFFGIKVTPWLTANVSLVKRRAQFVLQLIAAFFFIVALARPQMGQSEQEVKSEGVELMILADVSESMLAEDIKPSRLDQMKIELTKLIDLMPGNKTGLIAFAGSAALMSPLTSDPSALKMYIQSLDTYSVSSQGTSFETALLYAKEAFDKGGVTQDKDVKTTRVVIIASDGEDQEQGALEVAKSLEKDGIKIITIAYGTEKGATIPSRDQFGNLRGSKKNKSGEVVITQVKGEFLKSLAQAGDGHFYFASFGGEHLRQIMKDIDLYEKSQFDSSMVIQYDEKFVWPLSCGLILLVISLMFNDRKSTVPEWKGRYEYE